MDSQPIKPITILGAGSWGTAIALYLAKRGQTVQLWSYEIPEVAAMLAERTNERYLPGFKFPDLIQPTANLAEAVKDAQDVLIAVPSIGFRETLFMLKPLITTKIRIICATKGLDADTGELLHEVTKEVLGKEHLFAMLSGPSFAREVAAGLPSAVVIASHDKVFLQELMQRFNSKIFRTYPSHDVIGVELGGVIKNVIAIATGIADGMALGANARSALITQGLAETVRLGLA
ncbi:MAG TPA: NAD(P)H-dependent glycerol-3-phosphate dehydrogenase, partial [Gammaproteobacteria bacterium]|nr:NAD(P)H-dependent glycerol-3-phosphate dehydrogenase [Gammaproteobacteria bacterium]